MKKTKQSLIKIFIASVILLTFCLYCGVRQEKPRFTDEELENIPLPQTTGLPEVSGGYTLRVASETITSDEIIQPIVSYLSERARSQSYAEFSKMTKPELKKLVVNRISNILLFQQAKAEGGERIEEAVQKAVDAEIRRFVGNFGGDYSKAEDELKKMGMNWESFRDYQEKSILTQSYIHQQLPEEKPVTHAELLEYYNSNKSKLFTEPGKIEVQVIDIQPEKLVLDDPNESSVQAAKELTEQIMEKLNSGEDFGELAKQYSHGHTAKSGGMWEPIDPDSLAEPYDVLGKYALEIEAGQLAGPIESGGQFFIMKLLEKKSEGFIPFSDVQERINEKIRITRRKNAIEKFSSELLAQSEVGNLEDFLTFCLQKIYITANK